MFFKHMTIYWFIYSQLFELWAPGVTDVLTSDHIMQQLIKVYMFNDIRLANLGVPHGNEYLLGTGCLSLILQTWFESPPDLEGKMKVILFCTNEQVGWEGLVLLSCGMDINSNTVAQDMMEAPFLGAENGRGRKCSVLRIKVLKRQQTQPYTFKWNHRDRRLFPPVQATLCHLPKLALIIQLRILPTRRSYLLVQRVIAGSYYSCPLLTHWCRWEEYIWDTAIRNWHIVSENIACWLKLEQPPKCSEFPQWSGSGINSASESERHHLPLLDSCVKFIWAYLAQWSL